MAELPKSESEKGAIKINTDEYYKFISEVMGMITGDDIYHFTLMEAVAAMNRNVNTKIFEDNPLSVPFLNALKKAHQASEPTKQAMHALLAHLAGDEPSLQTILNEKASIEKDILKIMSEYNQVVSEKDKLDEKEYQEKLSGLDKKLSEQKKALTKKTMELLDRMKEQKIFEKNQDKIMKGLPEKLAGIQQAYHAEYDGYQIAARMHCELLRNGSYKKTTNLGTSKKPNLVNFWGGPKGNDVQILFLLASNRPTRANNALQDVFKKMSKIAVAHPGIQQALNGIKDELDLGNKQLQDQGFFDAQIFSDKPIEVKLGETDLKSVTEEFNSQVKKLPVSIQQTKEKIEAAKTVLKPNPRDEELLKTGTANQKTAIKQQADAAKGVLDEMIPFLKRLELQLEYLKKYSQDNNGLLSLHPKEQKEIEELIANINMKSLNAKMSEVFEAAKLLDRLAFRYTNKDFSQRAEDTKELIKYKQKFENLYAKLTEHELKLLKKYSDLKIGNNDVLQSLLTRAKTSSDNLVLLPQAEIELKNIKKLSKPDELKYIRELSRMLGGNNLTKKNKIFIKQEGGNVFLIDADGNEMSKIKFDEKKGVLFQFTKNILVSPQQKDLALAGMSIALNTMQSLHSRSAKDNKPIKFDITNQDKLSAQDFGKLFDIKKEFSFSGNVRKHFNSVIVQQVESAEKYLTSLGKIYGEKYTKISDETEELNSSLGVKIFDFKKNLLNEEKNIDELLIENQQKFDRLKQDLKDIGEARDRDFNSVKISPKIPNDLERIKKDQIEFLSKKRENIYRTREFFETNLRQLHQIKREFPVLKQLNESFVGVTPKMNEVTNAANISFENARLISQEVSKKDSKLTAMKDIHENIEKCNLSLKNIESMETELKRIRENVAKKEKEISLCTKAYKNIIDNLTAQEKNLKKHSDGLVNIINNLTQLEQQGLKEALTARDNILTKIQAANETYGNLGNSFDAEAKGEKDYLTLYAKNVIALEGKRTKQDFEIKQLFGQAQQLYQAYTGGNREEIMTPINEELKRAYEASSALASKIATLRERSKENSEKEMNSMSEKLNNFTDQVNQFSNKLGSISVLDLEKTNQEILAAKKYVTSLKEHGFITKDVLVFQQRADYIKKTIGSSSVVPNFKTAVDTAIQKLANVITQAEQKVKEQQVKIEAEREAKIADEKARLATENEAQAAARKEAPPSAGKEGTYDTFQEPEKKGTYATLETVENALRKQEGVQQKPEKLKIVLDSFYRQRDTLFAKVDVYNKQMKDPKTRNNQNINRFLAEYPVLEKNLNRLASDFKNREIPASEFNEKIAELHRTYNVAKNLNDISQSISKFVEKLQEFQKHNTKSVFRLFFRAGRKQNEKEKTIAMELEKVLKMTKDDVNPNLIERFNSLANKLKEMREYLKENKNHSPALAQLCTGIQDYLNRTIPKPDQTTKPGKK